MGILDVSVGCFYLSGAFCSSADGDLFFVRYRYRVCFTVAVSWCNSSAICSYDEAFWILGWLFALCNVQIQGGWRLWILLGI